MAFTAQDVKNLREQTGCGMMDCKKALTESNGDFDKAVEYLREKGLAAAAKKAGRIAAEGMVYAVSDVSRKLGVVVEVNAETDFVAKNDLFKGFVKDVAQVIMDQNPADVAALLNCKMGEGTVESALQEKILVIGENIKIRRFERYEGICAAYVHGGGTHGVLVQFDTSDEIAAKAEFAVFGKDIAMQIAAVNPSYLNEAAVPAEVLAKEKEILLAQISNDPKLASKPEQVKVKMVEGKIGKYYKENCLLDQQYVKDPDLTVSKYVENTAKELGGDIKVVKYVRFEKGDGLEKRTDDFAAEVAGMVK
ncbi:translation elongation factor Ts [uncultured Ruthenibacterium sp.]|uniref:translation elongation factor Ts n=1 Tax=uncultured Ruthenibacterium sp. TaxID=1905347 RepID=UPI00349E4D93